MLRSGEVVVILILMVPSVWALVDVLRVPTEAWAASNQSQGLWTLMVLVMPLLGPTLYFLTVKPRINESS